MKIIKDAWFADCCTGIIDQVHQRTLGKFAREGFPFIVAIEGYGTLYGEITAWLGNRPNGGAWTGDSWDNPCIIVVAFKEEQHAAECVAKFMRRAMIAKVEA